MPDPVNIPDSHDAEARKLAEAIDKLTSAAKDLGSLPTAIGTIARSAATGTPPGPSKPTKPESVAGWSRGKPTEDSSEGYKRSWAALNPPPRELTALPPPRPAQSPAPPQPEEMTDGPMKRRKPKATRLAKVWGAFKNTSPGRALTGSRAGRAVGSIASGAKQGAAVSKAAGLTGGGMAGAAGKAIPIAGAALAAVGAIDGFRKAIVDAAGAALETQRKYAELSAAQSAIFAEADMKQMQRDIKHGDATAGTTKELADSEDRRKDMMAPLNTAIENLQNSVVASANQVMTDLAEPFVAVATEMFKDLRKIKEYLFGKVDAKVEEFGTLNDIKDKINADAAAATNRALAKMAKARASAKREGFERPGEGR